MPEPTLDELRARIEKLDAELIAIAAERIALARKVGETKRQQQIPTVDHAREAHVLTRARETATQRGLSASVAEDVIMRLIVASISAQDEDSLRFAATGAGKRAVIIGGAGRMGRWLGRFLRTAGYEAGALDPNAPADENAWAKTALMSADLVVCSAPPATIASLYKEWMTRAPAGLIVDIASIKTPLVEPIRALRAKGARVASVHPMFGPSIVLLRDADVVICDTGDEAATTEIEQLFRPTTARLVRVPLEEHDAIMADLLSLAHATAITFALALPQSQHAVRSTTFQKLETLSAALVRESPDVYYEIQAKNPHSRAALEKLRAALERVVAAASSSTPTAFRELFAEAQKSTDE
ncbi:MAG TPA: prephenate dehydrogenase/arogenate dehydrogenase family protein [Gemmatimonadaceae bacterium]|nr:prephenate dehydrogenase/arogenate dehydrogenase family protein [Gemmatimonadaceae bacterium]